MTVAVPGTTARVTVLAVFLLLVCAAAVAVMPAFARYGFADGANVTTFIAIRATASLAILTVCLLVTGRSFRVPRPLVGVAALASISAALMNYTHLESIRYIDIGLSILILFVHPFVVAIYYHLAGQSRLSLARAFWSVTAFVGLGLALAVTFSDLDRYGLAMAFLSAFCATVLVIAMIKVSERAGGYTTNFHLALWTLAIFIVTLAVTGDVRLPQTAIGWASAVGNGTAHVIAFVAFLAAVRLIGASRASLFSFAEPVAAILLAAWLFDERMSLTQWCGVALVAAGLFFMEAKFTPRRKAVRVR
ncbi:MAG: DMT family transporter [Alphaproteobacteria bacterium]